MQTDISFREALKRQLRLHEGVRNKVYYDSIGIPTIGVGFNLNRRDAQLKLSIVGANLEEVLDGKPLTDAQVDGLFEMCIDEAISGAKTVVDNFSSHSPVRQRVLIDMCYNLGAYKLAHFKNMLSALKEKDYSLAARSMTRSLWFQQVGDRGIRLSAMMLTDVDITEAEIARSGK